MPLPHLFGGIRKMVARPIDIIRIKIHHLTGEANGKVLEDSIHATGPLGS